MASENNSFNNGQASPDAAGLDPHQHQQQLLLTGVSTPGVIGAQEVRFGNSRGTS